MDITPFNIEYKYDDSVRQAQIRPCCREDNVVDYAVWQHDKLAFTITKDALLDRWIIAMKNADDFIDDSEVQQIGKGIEQNYAHSHESR